MEQRALLLLFVAVTHVRAQQISNAPLDLGITAIVVGSVGIIIFLGVLIAYASGANLYQRTHKRRPGREAEIPSDDTSSTSSGGTRATVGDDDRNVPLTPIPGSNSDSGRLIQQSELANLI